MNVFIFFHKVLDAKKALGSDSNIELKNVSVFALIQMKMLPLHSIGTTLNFSLQVEKGLVSGNTKIIFEKAEVSIQLS